MKISDFIKDRVHTYLAALICLSMSAVFLRAFKAPLTMSLILVTIGVITFLFSELWDFYRKKNVHLSKKNRSANSGYKERSKISFEWQAIASSARKPCSQTASCTA